MPTLVMLLTLLLGGVDKNKYVVCFIASIILKIRYPKMGLVQRRVSVFLYGNGVSKEVYQGLQPLGVCMSHKATLKLVDRMIEGYDIPVQEWADRVAENIKECSNQKVLMWLGEIDADDDRVCEAFETGSDTSSLSFEHPPFSPVVDESCDNCSTLEEGNMELNEDTDLNLSTTTINQSDCNASRLDTNAVDCSEEEFLMYKLGGDNVDSNIHLSSRVDKGTLSLHYFHLYAVRDRINLSHLSDQRPPLKSPCEYDHDHFFPTDADKQQLIADAETLVSRILVQRMDVFSCQQSQVTWHIPSTYAKEIAHKSSVVHEDLVPLGVLLYNEVKIDEMCKILERAHDYLPSKPTEVCHTLPNGDQLHYKDRVYHRTLFGGDQLTIARARSAQCIRANEETAQDRLEGLIPVVEDWHTRVVLLKVIWKALYSSSSAQKKGTLYQLKNLISRTSVPLDCSKNVKVAEDFLKVVLDAHIVAAAHAVIKNHGPQDLKGLATKIVEDYANFDIPPKSVPKEPNDKVFKYASEVITLGLLWLCYHDVAHEGDGDRDMVYWKFLLVIFKVTNHFNYAKEAVNLFIQLNYTMSPRQAAQLKWSRFVNTHGRPGCNIPVDLHNEHLNRRFKSALRNLRSNVQPSSIVRIGKSISAISQVSQAFEYQLGVSEGPKFHTIPSSKKDFSILLKQLLDENIMYQHPKRNHNTFPIKRGIFQSVTRKQLDKWLDEKLSTLHTATDEMDIEEIA